MFDVETDLIGSVRTTAPRLAAAAFAIELRPDYIALTPDIVDYAVRQLPRSIKVICVVPEYAPHLSRALEDRGFEAQTQLVVLVKSMARRVAERVPARTIPTP